MHNELINQWETPCRCLIGIESVDSDISKIFGDYDKSDIPIQAWDMLGKNMSDGSIVLIQCEINGWPGLMAQYPGVGQMLSGYTRLDVINLIKLGDRFRLGVGGRYRMRYSPIIATEREFYRSLLTNKRACYAYLYTTKNNWLVTSKQLDWEPLRGDVRDNDLATIWRTPQEEFNYNPHNILTYAEEEELRGKSS